MPESLRVFMITSEWPSPEKPHEVPFIVRQVQFLRDAGVDVTLFHFRGRKNPVNYWKAWREAQARIQSGGFDLIHAQWGQSGLLALPKKLPLVVTFRGDDLEGIIGANGKHTAYGQVLKALSRFVARKADQIIVVSEALARSLPNKPYHVIPSGLDLQLFSPEPRAQAREKIHLSPTTRYVLFAGSAGNPRKRHSLARQAVALLKDEFDVELLVASGLTHDQIPGYMNASDVLLLTSLHEGSPNVVKEALAVNLPVISTDVGDVRQRISGIPGCSILSDDHPETIAAAIRNVLVSAQRTNSRTSILELDEKQLTEKVITIYKQAVLDHQIQKVNTTHIKETQSR
jgi:teichuronic acid biosynthesis glycosyltransferase TuaC